MDRANDLHSPRDRAPERIPAERIRGSSRSAREMGVEGRGERQNVSGALVDADPNPISVADSGRVVAIHADITLAPGASKELRVVRG